MSIASPQIQKVVTTWPMISDVVYVPHSEQEYEELVTLLDKLIDEVGEDEGHPLASLMDIIGTLIEKYEDEHIPEIPEHLAQKINKRSA